MPCLRALKECVKHLQVMPHNKSNKGVSVRIAPFLSGISLSSSSSSFYYFIYLLIYIIFIKLSLVGHIVNEIQQFKHVKEWFFTYYRKVHIFERAIPSQWAGKPIKLMELFF